MASSSFTKGRAARPTSRVAEDFPEDKYDFKVQKDQRTFAQNILNTAAVDYEVMRSISGLKIGPDFGKDVENPSREVYKTNLTTSAY
jgi:hypothetical protein